MVEYSCIRCWIAGADWQRGEEFPEVDEPGFQNGGRYEVDFVENEDQAFRAGVGGADLLFDSMRACFVGGAGVEDIEEDVRGREDGFKDFVVGAPGGLEGWV